MTILNPQYILSPINDLIDEAHARTVMGLRVIEEVKDFPEPTDEEIKHLQIMPRVSMNSVEATKTNFRNWILKKALEEIHTSIRESLDRMYVYIKVCQQLGVKEVSTDDLLELEPKLLEKASKFNFPTLMDRIEDLTKSKLQFREHITSINNARNCMVHTYGKVSERHCNNEKKDELTILGNRFRFFFKRGKMEFPAEIGKSGPENAALMLRGEEFQLVFKIDGQINIELKDYLGLLDTCIFFRADLEETIKKTVP